MDFSLSEEQEVLRGLARKVLEDQVSPVSLKAAEASGRFDRDLWRLLVETQLVGLSLPADVGGSDRDLMDACVVMEELGRVVAPVPLYQTVFLGALPIAQFTTGKRRQHLLDGVSGGTRILTGAYSEPGSYDPALPSTRAVRDGSGWRLEGGKTCVPYGGLAAAAVTTALVEDAGVGLFVVDLDGDGVSGVDLTTTTLEQQSDITFDGARVEPDGALAVGRDGAKATRWTLDRALAGICAMQVGVAEKALELTAAYTTGRVQFGRPLASFQAVQQRAADAYINVEAMRWTTWHAAWLLSQGVNAVEEVAIAKFWACEGGQQVVSAAQHLHGGMGVDVDYPLHRYFRFAKQIELSLGSATPQLLRLGAAMAAAGESLDL